MQSLCSDGADYSVNKQTNTSFNCYNARMMNEYIQKMISPVSNYNILTYQQVKAEEKIPYILPATEDTWKALKILCKSNNTILDDCKVFFFKINDAKFLYILTQHSLWNRLFHPFLLCKC